MGGINTPFPLRNLQSLYEKIQNMFQRWRGKGTFVPSRAAEEVGFEPTSLIFQRHGFRDRCLKPLGYSSL